MENDKQAHKIFVSTVGYPSDSLASCSFIVLVLNSNTTAAEVFSDFLECCETFILSFETLLVVIIITPDQ